jgi:hypothetical protein
MNQYKYIFRIQFKLNTEKKTEINYVSEHLQVSLANSNREEHGGWRVSD